MRAGMRSQRGFTLIELIAVIILLGVIAVLGTMFVANGMRGVLLARQADENGQRAQVALERIAIELRDANGGPGAGGAIQVLAGPPLKIVYTTSLTALSGTRTLQYSAGAGITLTPALNGAAWTLLDDVNTCTMTFSGTGASSLLTVSFTLANSPQTFSITVKPRNTSVTPVTS